MNTNQNSPTAAGSSLPRSLRRYAKTSAEVAQLERQIDELTEQSADVCRYVALQAAAMLARDREAAAYDTVTDAALSAYDGERRVHVDVVIDQKRAVAIADETAALLWLFCYAADAFEIGNATSLPALLERHASQNKLVLSKRRLQEQVDKLFVDIGFRVSGWVVSAGSAEPRWQHHVVDAATSQAARAQVEQTLTAQQGMRWHWRETPLVERHAIVQDYRVVAQPTTRLVARVRQDLTHLLNGKGGAP